VDRLLQLREFSISEQSGRNVTAALAQLRGKFKYGRFFRTRYIDSLAHDGRLAQT
jgi:hypothetical protein